MNNKTTFIALSSYTQAAKAARILNSRRISASVEKTSSVSGCVFGVRTTASRDTACAILEQNGISCAGGFLERRLR